MENLMRNVIVVNTKGTSPRQQKSVQVTTFADIMREFNLDINFNEMRVMEGNSLITIETANVVLPTEITTVNGVTNDLTILISPKKKTGSGLTNITVPEINLSESDVVIVTLTITNSKNQQVKKEVVKIVESEDLDLSTEELLDKYADLL